MATITRDGIQITLTQAEKHAVLLEEKSMRSKEYEIAEAVDVLCSECPIAFEDRDEDRACESCMVRLISEINAYGDHLGEERLGHWRALVETMNGRESATF